MLFWRTRKLSLRESYGFPVFAKQHYFYLREKELNELVLAHPINELIINPLDFALFPFPEPGVVYAHPVRVYSWVGLGKYLVFPFSRTWNILFHYKPNQEYPQCPS